jgi:ATP-binding cassette subfamily C protein CydCD
VDIRWPGADAPTVRNVDLDVPPGAHVAVVGPSGAGKSTLVSFLAGLLPAERGTATVPTTAWVPQEPHLVATTLRENLRIADPHATDDRLRDVLRQAALPDWADRLDDDPTTASGGEAQRIAIARALLADAELLLLDEPTAHFDAPTAARVLANLKGRTVVHVTHRPEEAAAADAVVELVSRAGNQAADSAAQLPAGGVAGPSKYGPVRGRTGALPAETWIHRLNHRISGAGH